MAELVARMAGSPLLALVGPSGAGKSSVLRAGLLPALARGVLPGAEQRAQARDAARRPPARGAGTGAARRRRGDTRRRPVRGAVHRLPRRTRADRVPRHASSNWRAPPTSRVQVVIAVRADFYGRCAAHERLARLVGANQVLVGPMNRDELRRAIVEPARRVGLRVEPSLTDSLIADVLEEPGGLPLLSAALVEQWRERDGRVMRRAAYERTGRCARGGRPARGGDVRAPDARRSALAARSILLRLADAGEQEGAFVRRRVPLDELELDRDEQAAAALAALTDSRLVTADEGTVEVAHEALLSEWPRLRSWLEEDAEGRRLHQHLIHAAREWAVRGPGPRRALPRGAARVHARLGHGSRARPERARACLSRREPSGSGARGRASASHEPAAACPARRPRRPARARARGGHRRPEPAWRGS